MQTGQGVDLTCGVCKLQVAGVKRQPEIMDSVLRACKLNTIRGEKCKRETEEVIAIIKSNTLDGACQKLGYCEPTPKSWASLPIENALLCTTCKIRATDVASKPSSRMDFVQNVCDLNYFSKEKCQKYAEIVTKSVNSNSPDQLCQQARLCKRPEIHPWITGQAQQV